MLDNLTPFGKKLLRAILLIGFAILLYLTRDTLIF
jgi:hypothetical protein